MQTGPERIPRLNPKAATVVPFGTPPRLGWPEAMVNAGIGRVVRARPIGPDATVPDGLAFVIVDTEFISQEMPPGNAVLFVLQSSSMGTTAAVPGPAPSSMVRTYAGLNGFWFQT